MITRPGCSLLRLGFWDCGSLLSWRGPKSSGAEGAFRMASAAALAHWLGAVSTLVCEEGVEESGAIPALLLHSWGSCLG